MMFQGIVEDRNDPLKLGRAKVRIFGIHTEERTTVSAEEQYLPTADLPWAEAAFPISSSNISGISDFMIPQHGSYVWLFFKDDEQQFPVYFATSPKIEKVPNFATGFTDPNFVYPDGNYTDESGISKLATGDNSEISKTSKTGVTSVGESWDEPANPYDTTYPENRVIRTKNHVIELDDTSGKERIHLYHVSGSFTEFHPNGDQVEKVKGKKYLIIEDSDHNTYVKGKYNITVESDCNLDVTGNYNISVTGNVNVTATGTCLVKGVITTIDGGGTPISGVITAMSICPFTGAPHIDPSLTVLASK